MKTITGCAFPILLFAVIFYAYASVFLVRVDPEWWAYLFAGVGALMGILIVGALKTIFYNRKYAKALSRARKIDATM